MELGQSNLTSPLVIKPSKKKNLLVLLLAALFFSLVVSKLRADQKNPAFWLSAFLSGVLLVYMICMTLFEKPKLVLAGNSLSFVLLGKAKEIERQGIEVVEIYHLLRFPIIGVRFTDAYRQSCGKRPRTTEFDLIIPALFEKSATAVLDEIKLWLQQSTNQGPVGKL